jgi:hypothetical protein
MLEAMLKALARQQARSPQSPNPVTSTITVNNRGKCRNNGE